MVSKNINEINVAVNHLRFKRKTKHTHFYRLRSPILSQGTYFSTSLLLY